MLDIDYLMLTDGYIQMDTKKRKDHFLWLMLLLLFILFIVLFMSLMLKSELNAFPFSPWLSRVERLFPLFILRYSLIIYYSLGRALVSNAYCFFSFIWKHRSVTGSLSMNCRPAPCLYTLNFSLLIFST